MPEPDQTVSAATAARVALLVVTLTVAATSARAEQAPLPPLTEPPSGAVLTGKFVWADLFTSDMETSRVFYEQLFGWRWTAVTDWPRPYGIFEADGVAVAGLVHRPPPTGSGGYGRWVHYLSVPDVPAAADLARRRAGRVLIDPQDIAERGQFAVLAGPDGAIFGVMRATSGDPPDYRAETGEWLWHQLFTRQPRAAGGFLRSLAGFEITDRPETHDIVDLVLSQGGHARASIGSLGESKASPTWLGFIRVRDIGTTASRIRELGGEILYQSSAEENDVAIVADPNGATVGLMRWQFPEDVP